MESARSAGGSQGVEQRVCHAICVGVDDAHEEVSLRGALTIGRARHENRSPPAVSSSSSTAASTSRMRKTSWRMRPAACRARDGRGEELPRRATPGSASRVVSPSGSWGGPSAGATPAGSPLRPARSARLQRPGVQGLRVPSRHRLRRGAEPHLSPHRKPSCLSSRRCTRVSPTKVPFCSPRPRAARERRRAQPGMTPRQALWSTQTEHASVRDKWRSSARVELHRLCQ